MFIIEGYREIRILKTGDIETQYKQGPDIVQLAPKEAVQIASSKYPVVEYKDYVLSIAGQIGAIKKGSFIIHTFYDSILKHIDEIEEWVREAEEDGYTIRFTERGE